MPAAICPFLLLVLAAGIPQIQASRSDLAFKVRSAVPPISLLLYRGKELKQRLANLFTRLLLRPVTNVRKSKESS